MVVLSGNSRSACPPLAHARTRARRAFSLLACPARGIRRPLSLTSMAPADAPGAAITHLLSALARQRIGAAARNPADLSPAADRPLARRLTPPRPGQPAATVCP